MDQVGGLDGLKNRSEKCEGPGEGGQRGKEPKWEMRWTRRGGVDGVNNRSGKCEGPSWRGGGDQRLFEKNFLKKKTKNINQTC
jgi:hypothetical protein